MPHKWLGAWLRRGDKEAARNWASSLEDWQLDEATLGDWRIGEWVRSSVHVYFRANKLKTDDPAVRSIYRSYLYSGHIACRALERLFDELRPDMQLLFNGRMSSTRIAFEIGRKKGVRAICEERGLVTGRVRLVEDTHCLDFASLTNLWQAWKSIPLSEEEVLEIDQHLDDRRNGKASSLRPFSPPISGSVEGHTRGPKPIWVLFTSSLDESASHDQEPRAFETQEEWINRMVTFFARHPDRELVIRVHPNAGSKTSFGTNYDDQRFFLELESQIPDNVKIVPSDAEVSSYDLMAEAEVGLVWHSTTAVEMAALGKRVFRVADAWMQGLDCVEKIGDKGSLEERLEDVIGSDADFAPLQSAVQARRWAYLLYYRSSYALPLVKQLDWDSTELLYDNWQDLRAGLCPSLDEIASIFTDGRSADRYPTATEAARQGADEASLTARLIAYPNPDKASDQSACA
jgi:hypothetical protein